MVLHRTDTRHNMNSAVEAGFCPGIRRLPPDSLAGLAAHASAEFCVAMPLHTRLPAAVAASCTPLSLPSPSFLSITTVAQCPHLILHSHLAIRHTRGYNIRLRLQTVYVSHLPAYKSLLPPGIYGDITKQNWLTAAALPQILDSNLLRAMSLSLPSSSL